MSGAQRPLVVVGAGGHGRVVLDAALATGSPVAGFLDPGRTPGELINGFPALGGDELLTDPAFLAAHRIVPAVGGQSLRRRLASATLAAGGELAVVIHPRSVVSPFASVGAGSVVLAGAIINTDARIGRFCIVNVAATVDHDVELHDGVQVCPGANLAGGVICEQDVFIGTGAALTPGVRIGAGAVVGAGATVIRDTPPGLTVVGIPARPIG